MQQRPFKDQHKLLHFFSCFLDTSQHKLQKMSFSGPKLPLARIAAKVFSEGQAMKKPSIKSTDRAYVRLGVVA